MNKVIRHEHVSAALLPESLRGDIAPDATVTVTVAEEARAADLADPVAALVAYRRSIEGPGVTIEEAVERVRALRDEWDD